MKKFLASVCIVLICTMCMASALTTRVTNYSTLHSITDINTPDTDLAAATGYFIAVPSGAVDLMRTNQNEAYANAVSLIVHVETGADADTVTQQLYGVQGSGPPQKIAQIVWTIGLAQVDATATNLWAETASVTSSHATAITVSGAAESDGVGSVSFDATGYRYIYGLWTADTGNPTVTTCLWRGY